MLHVDIGKQLAFDISPEHLSTLFQHEAVRNHIVYIGLRNILMDSHASCKRETYGDDEVTWRNNSKAMAEKKLAAMLVGEIRSNSSGPRVSSLDPVSAEARKIAKAFILPRQKDAAQIAKWGKSFNMTELKDILAEAIKRYAAKPETIATAKANVEAVSALHTDVIDL